MEDIQVLLTVFSLLEMQLNNSNATILELSSKPDTKWSNGTQGERTQ